VKIPLHQAIPALALCVFGLSAAANDIEPGKEFYTIRYAPFPIVMDGDLTKWTGLPVVSDPEFAVPKYSGTNANPTYVLFEPYNGGTWSGPDDLSASFMLCYDADNVYLGCLVTDDYHENMSETAWNGDSVQLMIADATRTQQIGLYNYALGGYEDNNGVLQPDPALTNQIIISYDAGPATDPTCNCATEAMIIRDSVNHKTYYEIRLPAASMGFSNMLGGMQFGLGICVNDGDAALVNGVWYGPDPGQEGQCGWGGWGPHAIVHGKTPSECALMTLATNNDIYPSQEYYTALRTTNAITIDGVLSEWTGAPVLSDPKFAIPKYSGTNPYPNYVLFEPYNGGTWFGPDDLSSAVQVLYDDNNVYLGIDVTDDYHENMSETAWNGDSAQLMIADATRTQQIGLYNYALAGYEDNNGVLQPDPALTNQIIISYDAGPASDPTCDCATVAVVKRDSVNKHTVYEIKLPAASMGLTPPLTSGMQFGLGMAINDGDGALVNGVWYGPDPGQEGQCGWGGLGCHAIVHGKTPSETALVTLGGTVSGSARFFFAAVNPTVAGMTFRVTDLGTSILNPSTVKLTIDGQPVTLVASPKVGGSTDFAYSPTAPPFPPDSQHTYVLTASDTNGNLVSETDTFEIGYFAILTKAMQAVSVDKTQPGFIWDVYQNDDSPPVPNSLASAELALAGQLTNASGTVLPNDADPLQSGPTTVQGTLVNGLYEWVIPTVINLDLTAGATGYHPTAADQMPGIPGTSGNGTDGLDAQVRTFVDLPAGCQSLAVVSDDSFRAQAGYINKPADGILIGQMDANTANVVDQFWVLDAGTYPIRVVYQNCTGQGYLVLSTVLTNGNHALLNDTANGGFACYSSGVAPNKPTTFSITAQLTGGKVQITWTQPGVVLQQSTDLKTWTDLTNATSGYIPTTVGTPAKFFRLKQ
jgi:hypothetical protein